MIKARVSNGDLVLGIDRHNIKKLKNGFPLRVKQSEVGKTEGDIIVIYGHTLDDVMETLNSAGLEIDERTKVNAT